MIGGLVAVLGRHFLEIVKLRAYAVAAYVAAAASLLFAFVFALVALRQWLFRLGYENPDVGIAIGFVVLAAIAVAVGVYVRSLDPPTRPATDLALLAGPPAARFAVRRLSPRAIAIGVVLLGGLMVGRRMARGRDSD